MSDLKIWQPMPNSHEAVVVSTVAIGLTVANFKTEATGNGRSREAREALISVETDAIKWTCDGTTPTAAVGHKANAGDSLTLVGYDTIRLFKAIRVTTDATLRVTYFGG